MPTHIRVDELAAELGVPEGTVVAELKTLGKPMMLGYAMVDEHSADKVRARISVPPASPDLDSRPMRVIDLAEELSVAFEGVLADLRRHGGTWRSWFSIMPQREARRLRQVTSSPTTAGSAKPWRPCCARRPTARSTSTFRSSTSRFPLWRRRSGGRSTGWPRSPGATSSR